MTVKSVGGVPTIMPPHGGEVLTTEQPAGDGVGVGGTVAVGVTVAVRVGVAVGVGVGVDAPDWAQYLPPVFKEPLPSSPPQTIISLPVHTAV